jgi:hypothetical protein
MVLEWTMPVAVGLMVGISVGVLIELKYIINMDRKIEHLIERLARVELRTEHELLAATKKKRINKRR